ncbi:MAG: hypothetical protein U0869_00560 [Chloroflexota bacterium]
MRTAVLLSLVLAALVPAGASSAAAASPSPSPTEPAVLTWERVPILATGGGGTSATGRPVELVWGDRGALLLFQPDRGDHPSLAFSPDGERWSQLQQTFASDRLTLEHVSSGRHQLVVAGRQGDRTVLWSSEDARAWHESTARQLGGLADERHLAFGDAIGQPLRAFSDGHVWSSVNGRGWGREIDAPESDPARSVGLDLEQGDRLRAVLDARDGFLAVATDADGARTSVYRSRNRADWTPWTSPAPALPPDATAWAADGGLMTVDRIAADRSHELLISADAKDWSTVAQAGDPPTGAHPLLAMRGGALILATDAGVWHGTFDHSPLLDVPPPTPPAAPALGPIGADPPPGDPVQPTGRTLTPTTDRPADLDTGPDALRIEAWLPEETAGPGDTLAIHVRLTNGSERPFALLCPMFRVQASTSGLYPDDPDLRVTTQRWSGSPFDQLLVLMLDLEAFRFSRQDPLGQGCERGDGKVQVRLRPGETLEGTATAVLRAPYGDQALPAGPLSIAVAVSADLRGSRNTPILSVSGDLQIDGPAWPWASPGQVLDAIGSDPRIIDLVERAKDVTIARADTAEVVARLPDGVLPPDFPTDQLLAYELRVDLPRASRFIVSDILVDPWTAQVIDVRTR